VAAPKQYPDELRQRAIRLWREAEPKPVIRRLAEQLGVHPEALRNWIRQDEADRGERDDRPTSGEVEELRRLRRENAELKRANEILKAASAYFASEIDPTGGGHESGGPASWPIRGRSRVTGPGGRVVDLLRVGSGGAPAGGSACG
jgi:transposase